MVSDIMYISSIKCLLVIFMEMMIELKVNKHEFYNICGQMGKDSQEE